MKLIGLCLCLLLMHGSASGALFKYIDPSTRVTSYTNFRPPGRAAWELRLPPQRPGPDPRADRARGADGAVERGARPQPALGASEFPRISAARQQQLDVDRRHILSVELEAELQAFKLAQARASPAAVLHRHDQNLAALRRELARLR